MKIIVPEVERILTEIAAEVERASKKFPTWPTDPLHATAIIAEECGELQKAVLEAVYEPDKDVTIEDVRKEAVHTAAMCVRFLLSLSRYEFKPSVQHEQGGGVG